MAICQYPPGSVSPVRRFPHLPRLPNQIAVLHYVFGLQQASPIYRGRRPVQVRVFGVIGQFSSRSRIVHSEPGPPDQLDNLGLRNITWRVRLSRHLASSLRLNVLAVPRTRGLRLFQKRASSESAPEPAQMATGGQDPALQPAALKKAGCKTVFKDEGLSGAATIRPCE